MTLSEGDFFRLYYQQLHDFHINIIREYITTLTPGDDKALLLTNLEETLDDINLRWQTSISLTDEKML